MSSLFTHIFIPLAILLIFSEKLNISKKIVIILSFFAIFPDIDMFLFHRATLHNIFLLIILLLIYIFYKNITSLGIIIFYIYSHVLLDTFNAGAYIFYPFYKKVVYLMIGLSYGTYTDYAITPIFEIITNDVPSDKDFVMKIISQENIATFILITIMFIIVYIKHKSLNSKKLIIN